MRDVTTSVAAFLVLLVIATGLYLSVQGVQARQPVAAREVFDVQALEEVVNTLLSAGEVDYPPPPTLTPRPVTPSPSPTPTPTAVILPTATPTPPPPPPTPAPPPSPTPASPTPAARPRFLFVLAGTMRHDNACPGEYVMGTVRDARGVPLAGITVRMEDEYGNGDTRVTKGNPGEVGRYDFVLLGPPRRVYVWIVDEGGNPLSPRVEILHRLPNSGYEAFRCHYVDWQRTR